MRLQDWLRQATEQLVKAGVDSPRLCAQVLLQEVLHCSRIACVQRAAEPLTEENLTRLDALLARRATGEPLAYITGRKEFYGRDFQVSKHTLIPRPDTEILVEQALKTVSAYPQGTLLDLGTGTGCIGLTLLLEMPHWRGILLDCSHAALAVAGKNAAQWGVLPRTCLVQARMDKVPLPSAALTLVVANPPYIAEEEKDTVMGEVLHFEPHTALFSEQAGLAHLRQAVSEAARLLQTGGHIFLEHGWQQGAAVRQLLAQAAVFQGIATARDWAGHERCTFAQKVYTTCG